jgi:hypothetical protein
MDVALLLLWPIIGGYYLARHWNFSRFRLAREDGHRLYFRAALYGTILFIAAYLARIVALAVSTFYSDIEALLAQQVVPMLKPDPDTSGANVFAIALTSFYALALGVCCGKPLNFFFRQDRFLEKAVQDNDFERLIHTAAGKESPISVTVENHKVYVGYVAKTTDPSQERKMLGVLPVMSGYRHDDGEVEFTTFYSDVYEEIYKGEGGQLPHLVIEDFEIVIPVDKIHSVNMFDIVAYEQFGRRHAVRTKTKRSN